MPSTLTAATATVPAKFRWDTVPPGERAWLQRRQEDVLTFTYRTACDTVRIGILLQEVRSKLGHGLYEAWVRAELPFSVPTATRYRQVAAAFGRFENVHFERFDPTALYVLAQLSVPDAVREHAVTMVDFGQRITHADALEIIDAHRPVPTMEPAESTAGKAQAFVPWQLRKCLSPGCSATFPAEFPGICEKCKEKRDTPACGPALSGEQVQKRWAALMTLAEECTELRIAKIEDTEDDEPLYSVTCTRPDPADASPRNAVRRDLYDALTVLTGTEATRYCSGCRKDCPLGVFGKNRLNPGGLMYRCRPCEKTRRAAMRAEARKARNGGQSGAGDKKVA